MRPGPGGDDGISQTVRHPSSISATPTFPARFDSKPPKVASSRLFGEHLVVSQFDCNRNFQLTGRPRPLYRRGIWLKRKPCRIRGVVVPGVANVVGCDVR